MHDRLHRVGLATPRWLLLGWLGLTVLALVAGTAGVGAAQPPRLLAVSDLPPGFSPVGQVVVSTTVSRSLVDPATCQVSEGSDRAAVDAYTVRFSRTAPGASSPLSESVGEYRDVASAKPSFAALVAQSKVLARCKPATVASDSGTTVFESTSARFPAVGDASFAARVRFVSTGQRVLDVTFRSRNRVAILAFAETGVNAMSPKDETRVARRAASLLAKTR